MYYKQYWVSYVNVGEEIACAVCNQDMTNFVNTKEDQDYMHMLYCFLINRYEFEHCRDYLDKNGLYLGIFPPEIIEECIKDWNEEQIKLNKKSKERYIEDLKNPISEEIFEKYLNNSISIKTVLFFITNRIEDEKKYYGKVLYPMSYYNNYFEKHFGVDDICEYLKQEN